MTLAVEAQGAQIETVEGLMQGEELGSVQEAFLHEDAFQCGYCTPGQVVAAEGLLRANPDPDEQAIRVGMSGNLCRCGAYIHITRAVKKAARNRSGT
jgi:xanthine dehydrogenase YagT iron-sulfur-binding subunit